MYNIRRVGRCSSSIRNNLTAYTVLRYATIPNLTANNHTSNDTYTHKTKPRIRPDLFTGSISSYSESYQNLATDMYPNPLYNMSKEEILHLSISDYLHLLTIPYKSITETDKFCFNIIEIVNELIILDAKRATILLMSIADPEMSSIIMNTLRKYFENDRVKSSILEYMRSATSASFRVGFFDNISYILGVPDKTDDEKSEILMSYLHKLALVGNINNQPLILNAHFYDKIFKLIPVSRYAEFFSYMVNLNIQTYSISQTNKLKNTLIMGSNIEKFVARTGWMDPKWHDTDRPTFDDSHKEKMINFFSIKDLKVFAMFAIKKENIVDATLYLNLLVSKFERKCVQMMDPNFKRRPKETLLTDDIQTVLNVILNYIMVFKGSQNCIKVLKYMIKNNLEVKFENLLSIMTNLRSQGYYQEALLLMNSINLGSLRRKDLVNLIEEILQLIKEKYPTSPKILIGYIASIFNKKQSDKDTNTGLELLDRLNLLSVVYSDGLINRMTQSFSIIQRANVDQKLTGFEFTPNALTRVYDIILNSLPETQLTPNYIFKLYQPYIQAVKDTNSLASMTEQDPNNIFLADNLDDHVITLFIKHLLKVNPASPEMELVTTESNFETAKTIITEFLGTVDLKRNNRSVYVFDLLIYTSLSVHQDYAFASKMIRKSRSYCLPFSFNQIYPFIMFHYYRGEFKQAELWYNELVRHGVRSRAAPAKNLFKVARELNWDVNGFVYRKLGIHRNYKKREEIEKLHRDPVLFIDDNPIEDEVTDELIEGESSNQSDFNFSDELASILYQADLVKSTQA